MAARDLPPREYACKRLAYDPETGQYIWLPQTPDRFRRGERDCKVWNKRFAGKPAGASSHGYVSIMLDGRLYLGHRLAWLIIYGEPVPTELDHRDGDPSNNRISNIRAASSSNNRANSRRSKKYTAGVKGIRFKFGKYYARIMHNKKEIHLGHFDTLEEAIAARRAAAELYHGEFARHD
jgi:hypothetical protein